MTEDNISWRSSIGRGKGQHIVTTKSGGGTDKKLEDLDEPFTLRLNANCSDVEVLRELEKSIAQKIASLGGQRLLTDFDD